MVPLYLFLNYIFEGFEKLLTTIRDDAYLIGKRLHNLERPNEPVNTTTTTTDSI